MRIKLKKILVFSFAHRKRQTPGEEEHSRYKQRDQGLSKPLNGDSNNRTVRRSIGYLAALCNRRHLRIHKGSISLKVSRNPRNYNESDLGSRRDRLTLSGGIKIKMFFAIMWVYILNAFENWVRAFGKGNDKFSPSTENYTGREPPRPSPEIVTTSNDQKQTISRRNLHDEGRLPE